jgi:hypothetical protein
MHVSGNQLKQVGHAFIMGGHTFVMGGHAFIMGGHAPPFQFF